MLKQIIFSFSLIIILNLLPHFVEAATNKSATTTNVHDASKVQEQVRAEFKDVPQMIDIARCESNFRQFTDAGNVLYGGWDNQMIGIFQVFASIHTPEANKLNLDLTTIDGNIKYARYLYTHQGLNPWESSRDCWGKKISNKNDSKAQIKKLKRTIARLERTLKRQQSKKSK